MDHHGQAISMVVDCPCNCGGNPCIRVRKGRDLVLSYHRVYFALHRVWSVIVFHCDMADRTATMDLDGNADCFGWILQLLDILMAYANTRLWIACAPKSFSSYALWDRGFGISDWKHRPGNSFLQTH